MPNIYTNKKALCRKLSLDTLLGEHAGKSRMCVASAVGALLQEPSLMLMKYCTLAIGPMCIRILRKGVFSNATWSIMKDCTQGWCPTCVVYIRPYSKPTWFVMKGCTLAIGPMCVGLARRDVFLNATWSVMKDCTLARDPTCVVSILKALFKAHLVFRDRLHSGNRPYVCSTCHNWCLSKANWLIRKISLWWNALHVVSVKTAFFRACLVTPERLHFGEMPYVCNICQNVVRLSMYCCQLVESRISGDPC